MRYTVFLALVLAGCASRHRPQADAPAQTRPAPPAESREKRIARSIERGVKFILSRQNPDGSWGTGHETRGFEVYSMVPGSHDAFRVATTALCVMALREVGEKAAHDRGVEYLVSHGEARRDSGDLMYNVWAHMFVIHALAIEMRSNPDPRIVAAIKWHLDRLVRYETYIGGWQYYDFEARTQQPSGEPTSFTMAGALVALWEARQSGIELPRGLAERAVRRLGECRLPNGAYLYGTGYRYIPRLDANQIRGSIGRIQPCNDALWLWHGGNVGEAQVLQGLEVFAKEHVFIDLGRRRQFPHEAYYQTAPYYYYFDHYYAARLVERLKPDDRQKYAPILAEFILPNQEKDGSWWDYAMWDYHKPYGTAFAIMTLLRCR